MASETEWPPLDRHSHIPLYEQLKRVLEGAIVTGRLQPGDLLPPESRLCDLFGVSTITVRRALFDMVTDGKLIRHVGRGTFVAEASRPLEILMLFVGFQDEQWRRRSKVSGELIGGVGTVLWGNDATFSVERISESTQASRLSELVKERRYDGVILRPEADLSAWVVDLLEDHRIHYVAMKRRLDQRPANTVVADNLAYGQKATAHLLALGHTEVAYISGWGHLRVVRERLSGFEGALAAAGLQPNEEWVFLSDTGYPEDGYKSAYRLLDRVHRPSAVVVGSEGTSLGLYAAAGELGISIPDELAVVGVDESGQAQSYRPPMTSCEVTDHDLAAVAAQTLLQQIIEGRFHARETVLEPTLVERESCQPAASGRPPS